MEPKKYDAIIVGSGQAGTPLAFKLAGKGLKVAFIEKEHLGGTCLNVGCTPTKTYVASARRMWEAHHGDELGIEIPEGTVANLKKVKSRKDELVKKSVSGITKGVESNENIDLIWGSAKFVGHKIIEVDDKKLTADKIFINVGARARVPENFNEANHLTNQTILNLSEIPKHLIIIGGSYIGLEFGQMFRRFGSEVTIIEKSAGIIGNEDDEISLAIMEFMEKEGVKFELNADCISAHNNNDGTVSANVKCGEENHKITGSHLLLAVGRTPNTDLLDLKKTEVETDDSGNIVVNDFLETTQSGIFALGDCNGKGAFTHTAYNDFEIVWQNLFENGKRKVSDRISTYCLFVDPPLGRAGLTKKAALDEGHKIMVASYAMAKVARAKEKGETHGLMEIIIDKSNDQILGASVLGTGGDEIISSILNLMYAQKPFSLIRDAVFPHPTVSELIPTMLENPKEFV